MTFSLVMGALLDYLSASKWFIPLVALIGSLRAIGMLVKAVKKDP